MGLVALVLPHGWLGYLTANWHVDWWALVIVGIPFGCYWRGHVQRMRRTIVPEERAGYERRALLMVLATVAMVVGFFSPVVEWAMVYQWVHMIWHLDLMIVVPPLVILADPWSELAEGVPTAISRRISALAGRLAAHASVRRTMRLASSPWTAVVAFDAAMWIWHLPGPFDWAMASEGRMELMMFSFFFSGLMMWYVAIDPNPNRWHEGPVARVGHMVAVSMSCMLLAILLGLSSGAWYSAYDAYMGTYRTMSLLADQQIAAGILWVFGAVPWFIAGVVTLRDFLAAEERGEEHAIESFRRFALRKVRVPANPGVRTQAPSLESPRTTAEGARAGS
jgi:cytochrome c oxidase assembly factor CtaG